MYVPTFLNVNGENYVFDIKSLNKKDMLCYIDLYNCIMKFIKQTCKQFFLSLMHSTCAT